MRIEKLTLHNVGPFEDATIEFKKPEPDRPDLANVTLLVGENGTGKSTILYALSVVLDTATNGYRTELDVASEELLLKRCRTGSSVTVESSDWKVRVHAGPDNAGRPTLWVSYEKPPESHGRLTDFVGFGYAGTRTFQGVDVKAIEELRDPPLKDALSFTKSVDAQRFAQWLVMTNYSRLQEQENRDSHRFSSAIARIENALSDVLGEPLKFKFPSGQLTPRVLFRGQELSFDVLPDGVVAVLGWLADVHVRLNRVSWKDDLPIEQREFLLLLDEIDVHLHPSWQRRVLPAVQKLFPKAQIIATTHSPLVVASADDAHVLVLKRREQGQPDIIDYDSQKGHAYPAVLSEIFGVDSDFDIETKAQLDRLNELQRDLLTNKHTDRAEFDQLVKTLAARSEELSQIVAYTKRQLDKQLGA